MIFINVMKLKYIIKEELRKFINESHSSNNIKNILLDRIPFLKEYKIYKHPRDEKRFEAQRVTYNKDFMVKMGDETVIFPQYNVSSEVIYYPHKINDNIFHNFIIINEFHVIQPEEMDNLTFRVFLMAINQLEKKFSYRKEFIVKIGEEIPKEDLDIIINEMNGTLFKIEEFTDKHNINLF